MSFHSFVIFCNIYIYLFIFIYIYYIYIYLHEYIYLLFVACYRKTRRAVNKKQNLRKMSYLHESVPLRSLIKYLFVLTYI